MWLPLEHPLLVSTYLKSFPQGKGLNSALVSLLESLARSGGDGRIYAVTSLGNLRFTTAPDYREEAGHAAVWVVPHGDSFSVAYSRAGEREAHSTAFSPAAGLEATVRAFLMRLLKGQGGDQTPSGPVPE